MKYFVFGLLVLLAVPASAEVYTKSPYETTDQYYRRHAAEDYSYERQNPNSLNQRQGTVGDFRPAQNPYSSGMQQRQPQNTYNPSQPLEGRLKAKPY